MDEWTAIDREIDARIDGWVAELVEYCSIPSETGSPEGLRRAASWTADRLRAAGAAVEILEVDGSPPLVVGTIGDGPRTLSAVQHYDVQPAEPLDHWTTPPYAPAIREGRLYARGATDNKGEFLPRVWAVEAWRATMGELPCRVRFLVEGEEESGSPRLADQLRLRPDLTRADGALIEGGGLDPTGRAEIAGGGRGMATVELVARTIAYDAHSSASMLLPNAAIRMAQAIASLVDADGLPAVDWLHAGIREPSAELVALVDAQPLDDLHAYRAEMGVSRFLAGRDGSAALRASTFEPTINVSGLWAGQIGPAAKTITPAEAHARIDMRLVPDQDPDVIVAGLRAHLLGHGFGDIEVVATGGERAWWTHPDHPLLGAAARASEAVTGLPVIRSVAMAGTVPMYEVCAEHRVPATLLGASREDCRAHAPDENVRLDDLRTATRITTRFLREFAALESSPPVP